MSAPSVLLVDDEPDIRRIAQLSLGLVGGFRVLLAASGPEAVAAAERERPDVILLDVMMPGMDGPSTLGQLRLRPSTQSIPVIFMTAKVRRGELDQLASLGVHGILCKPFDPMTLAHEVRALLAR